MAQQQAGEIKTQTTCWKNFRMKKLLELEQLLCADQQVSLKFRPCEFSAKSLCTATCGQKLEPADFSYILHSNLKSQLVPRSLFVV